MIEVTNLKLGYQETYVFNDISFHIPQNKITILIGANGSGKSTLLKAIARLLPPKQGVILLDHQNINQIPSKQVAKKMAMLPQSASAPDDLTIYDLVKQGRYPHHSLFSSWSKIDEDKVQYALEQMGLNEIKHKKLNSLSGGQRQRAWIALALCQDTEYILLDEPTNHLDMKYQIEILELLRKLNQEFKKTIVMVLHDINYAIRYGDHLISLVNGQIYNQGSKEDIINEKMIFDVYQTHCKITHLENIGMICIPYHKDR